jgi:NADPH2:quinone reductase
MDIERGREHRPLPESAPAIVYREYGGPEVLELEMLAVPGPAAGEALLHHTAISVNFSDVNARRGGFYVGQEGGAPVIPGNEAVGEIVALGDGVEGHALGDKVAYAGMGGPFFVNSGAYAAYRAVPVSRLVPLPAGLDDIHVAATLAKGLTASAAINRFHRPAPGETVLVHAAASGVGLILSQWAKHCGARVLGTVGSAEKALIAAGHGCDETILYRETDFVAAVRAICPQGVAVVYDGVGKDTLIASLDCLRPFGKLVNYGNASGPAPAVDLMLLSSKGSLSIGRLALGDHIRAPEDYQSYAAELFGLLRDGTIRPHVQAVMPLSDAADAHRLVEAGRGAGAIVLVP